MKMGVAYFKTLPSPKELKKNKETSVRIDGIPAKI
jgi:hypothetical protein